MPYYCRTLGFNDDINTNYGTAILRDGLSKVKSIVLVSTHLSPSPPSVSRWSAYHHPIV